MTVFISPNEISPGGLTGISTVLNHLFGIPLGLSIIVLNLPIFIIGFIKFGGRFIIKTFIVTLIQSINFTLAEIIYPIFYVDKILASVFGGILMGLGVSIVLRHGATTGGVDIIAKIINSKFRHLTVGRLILIMDTIIIFLAAIVYKNIESILYSVVSLYASSRVTDIMLYGADKGRIVYIVTDNPNEICNEINSKMRRGVTIIRAIGGYTGNDKNLLFCTVRIHEVSSIYGIVDKLDKNAFIVVSEAGEIIGEGFKLLK